MAAGQNEIIDMIGKQLDTLEQNDDMRERQLEKLQEQ